MDDEEYSYAALQEPLYRVETGNYEYRSVNRIEKVTISVYSVWDLVYFVRSFIKIYLSLFIVYLNKNLDADKIIIYETPEHRFDKKSYIFLLTFLDCL